MFKPVQEKQEHKAFSSWLETFVTDSDNDSVSKEIRDLAHFEGNVDAIIAKASGIVNEHSDYFEFPFETEQEKDVQELLLSGWNKSQQGDNMGSAVLIEGTKAHTILPNYGLTLSYTSEKFDTPQVSFSYGQAKQSATHAPSYLIAPFESGIAIGAP